MSLKKICEVCEVIFETPDRRIKTCGDSNCVRTLRQRNNAMNRPEAREKVRQSKLGARNPNYKADKTKICVICLQVFTPAESRVKTCGQPCTRKLQSQNNGMKNPEVAARVQQAIARLRARGEFQYFAETEKGKAIIAKAARKRMLVDNPMFDPEIAARVAKKTGERMRQEYASGKRSPKTYRYRDYTKLNGTVVRLQSSYEEAYATLLDKQEIEWVCHAEPECPKLRYFLGDVWRTYHPDFYLLETGELIDTKSSYFLTERERCKLDAVRRSNPGIKLLVLTERELLDLGVPKRALNYPKVRDV